MIAQFDTTDEDLNRALSWFVKHQEKTLRRHTMNGKVGWEGLERKELEIGLRKEFTQLIDALHNKSGKEIRREAVDLANFCVFAAAGFNPKFPH